MRGRSAAAVLALSLFATAAVLVLGKDSISATGTMKVRQTGSGIKPISVAGVVNVKDELEIAWRVVARAHSWANATSTP